MSEVFNTKSKTLDLHKACRIGEITEIQQAIQSDPNLLNTQEITVIPKKLGWTPLYRTVLCGHFEAIKYLLEQGADANVANFLGETPLHQASDNSQLAIAQLLLENGADPNKAQNDGDSPLHLATFREDFKMVQLLLDFNADPNKANFMVTSKQFRRTPLHYAASSNSFEIVDLLLKHNADAFIKDKQGKAPAQLAASRAVKDLLEESDLISSFTEGTLSPIPGDTNITENVKLLQPIFLSTFGAKKTFELEFEVKPIFEWLSRYSLTHLYEPLVNSGFDSIEVMANLMAGPLPITEETLMKMGVQKAGDRMRLIHKLKEEAGIFPSRIFKNKNSGIFRCCRVPSNATGIMAPSLLQWLDEMRLGKLYEKFERAGFGEYDTLVCMMRTDTPVTHALLQNDIGIEDERARNKILRRLERDTEFLKDSIFDESQSASCGVCCLM